MKNFRAFCIDQVDDKIVADFRTLNIDDLTEGEVIIKVSHSTINYKDALAATGAGRILRRYPLNGGIDLLLAYPIPDALGGQVEKRCPGHHQSVHMAIAEHIIAVGGAAILCGVGSYHFFLHRVPDLGNQCAYSGIDPSHRVIRPGVIVDKSRN